MRRTTRFATAAVLVTAGLLSGCGGGSSSTATADTSAACDLPAQQAWLKSYMSDWYYFYSQIPAVDALSFTDIRTYYDALIAKTDSSGKALDRWSYVQDSASYSQFFGEGKSLGYGLFVAGQANDPLPLRVRYVAPGSGAEVAGLRRGMVIDQINGLDPAALKAANNFAALTPNAAGDIVTLVVRDTPQDTLARTLLVTGSVYTLAPVSNATVLTSPAGRQAGYLVYKDFVSTGQTALSAALTQFKAAGVTELVVDLRYNGGGLISASRDLASAIGGGKVTGQRYATLVHNDRHQASNESFDFNATLPALALTRVYVLTGVRTCSASELVINGLSPFIEVVQVGSVTCGKPYGFTPVTSCANTYSAVNFESFNARNAGRYYDGLTPTCPVVDDLDHPLGDANENLTATALRHMDGIACPLGNSQRVPQSVRIARGSAGGLNFDGDTPAGMNMQPR